jgi:hypothetical protein
MYQFGQGTQPDFAKALAWYRLAAEQGNKNGIATGNLASRLGPVALHHRSQVVHRSANCAQRNPYIQPAQPRRESSNWRKEFCYFPSNSGPRLNVVDAPVIDQPSGIVVVGEFLPAIQASNIGSRAVVGSARQVRGHALAQCYRRAFVPMVTRNSKTHQRPEKQRDSEDHAPPRLRSRRRALRFQHSSRRRAIQNDRSLDPVCPSHFFLPLILHVRASTGC